MLIIHRQIILQSPIAAVSLLFLILHSQSGNASPVELRRAWASYSVNARVEYYGETIGQPPVQQEAREWTETFSDAGGGFGLHSSANENNWGGISQSESDISVSYREFAGNGQLSVTHKANVLSQYFGDPVTGVDFQSTKVKAQAAPSPNPNEVLLEFFVSESVNLKVKSANAATISTATIPDGINIAGKIGAGGVLLNGAPLDADPNGLELHPGLWTLAFSAAGAFAEAIGGVGNDQPFPNPRNTFARAHTSFLWTFDDIFPGQTLENYGKGNTGYSTPSDNEDDEPPPASDAANVAGVALTMPIIGNVGHTGKFFAGIPTQVEAGPLTGAQVTGYTVTSEYEPLTSFIIPTLPGGAENLSITFNEQSLLVVAGQEVDFGPGGAQEFALSGIDPTAPGFTPGDLVMGLQFAAEGLASLIAIPTLYIPPGDYNENGLVDAADYTVWRDTEPHLPEGYDLWRSKFGPPGGADGAGQAVPEPGGSVLLVMAAFVIVATGHCSRVRRRGNGVDIPSRASGQIP